MMKRSLPLVSIPVLLLATAQAAVGQSFQIPAKPQERPGALVNAVIHPVSSEPIENGYVLFDQGRITAIGIGAFHPGPEQNDWAIYDAGGMHVYPGLISADSTLGLLEIGAVRATNDLAEVSESGFSPEVIAATAVNPDSAVIPVTRANGILTALTVPQGKLISGYASLIRLDGWTTDELTIRARAGMVVRWPDLPNPNDFLDAPARGEGGPPAGGRRGRRGGGFDEAQKNASDQIKRIDDAFHDAAAYIQARRVDASLPMDIRLEAFGPVIAGSAPLFIYVSQAPEIRSAVAWAQRMNLRAVIVGGAEADECAELLKSADVPVIVVGTHRLPGSSDDAFDDPFTLPGRLHEAGVRFCVASGEETAHERSLPYHAATAAAYGLSPDEALKAVTLYPAQILGLGDTHGSIEIGKAATLLVTTGSPLEITSEIKMAFIEGSPVDLSSRHTQFFDKYRERARQEGTPTAPPPGPGR